MHAPGAGNPLPEGAGLFGIDARVEGPEVVIMLRGELDLATAPMLSDALFSAIREGRRRIVIDLAGLTFMDASGVHAIAVARRAQLEGAGELVLRRPEANVRRLLDILDLDHWLEPQEGVSIDRSAARARDRRIRSRGVRVMGRSYAWGRAGG